ncbi:helicase POLQ-like [Octopus bimaculoides]|uniref:Helicase POLQ-like n=1 Tax=Octopus bimaculoides TaxID=37653 RepID=A0A0L8IAB6_OCTBM|nr:helicase POLQ-like [Octopus bimaculoides]|eukprot:XP_014782396.1 PREDICTED: helicase POLQ-like [Octopus bimaculoides]
MNDDVIEEGPCRKARVQKRALSHYSLQFPSASRRKTEDNQTENSSQRSSGVATKASSSKISPQKKQIWFKSTFAEEGYANISNPKNSEQMIRPIKTSGHCRKESKKLSSTHLSQDILIDDGDCDDEGDLFENSDADLAELDISGIAIQYDRQQNAPQTAQLTHFVGAVQQQKKFCNDRTEEFQGNKTVTGLYETPPDEIIVQSESADLFSGQHLPHSVKTYSTELFSLSPLHKPAKDSTKTSSAKVSESSPFRRKLSKESVDADHFSPTRSSQSDMFSSSISTMLDSIFGNDDFEIKKKSLNHFKNQEEKQVKNSSKEESVLSKEDDTNSKTSSNPKTMGTSFLKKHIHQRLFQNAQGHTSQNIAKYVEKMQHDRRAEAEAGLEIVQKEKEMGVGNFDIGPFYGLPLKVKELFEKQRGIKKLYDWQEECLSLAEQSTNQNLIYSLPTSGGKTLVAEILILRQLLCQKKNAMLVLPYVSIVQEKVKAIAELAVELNFHVEEYAGSKGRYPPINRPQKGTLYIATIEKAHSLINQFIELNRMGKLGLMVVDELHMLGEGGRRGAVLEATLIKTLSYGYSCQIIGMSATLSNINDLKTFLKAELYINDFRPVTLTEYIKLDDNIYRVCPKFSEEILVHNRVATFQYKKEMCKIDPDHLLGLVLEVIPDNSCLVFCSTKKNCENVATMLTKMLAKYKRNFLDIHKSQKKQLLKDLKADNNGYLCPVLAQTIPFGLAYHHSGLTSDERRSIEDAYSSNILCLLACTSTLAAGVNLPAKRVILRSPYVGKYFISRCRYLQMIGRAGRAGIDKSGESILIVAPKDKEKVKELISKPMESCHSSLAYDDGKGIRLLILSLVGLQIATDVSSLFVIISNSLLNVQSKELECDINELTKNCLQSLLDLGLVKQKQNTASHVENADDKTENSSISANFNLAISDLGRAVYKGSIDIDISDKLYNDLKKSTEMLVVSNYLHMLALTTPYDIVSTVTPSWIIYFKQLSSLKSDELSVANYMGITENYVARKASGQVVKQPVDEFAVNRFYLTLMLFEVWKQKTIWEVAKIFQQPRGFVQNLVSSALSFATCVSYFCKEIKEFWGLSALFELFIQQLSYSTILDLIPLIEIPGVKKGRAHQLYNAGYKTLALVAKASVKDLVKDIEHMSKKLARQIIASAQLLLDEKREALLEEIEQLVTIPEFAKQHTEQKLNEETLNVKNKDSNETSPTVLSGSDFDEIQNEIPDSLLDDYIL